jgi:hypothetical protein
MTKGVQRADRVLLIGTPEYKRKSELYDSGGVKYEDQLITIELYHKMGSSKFVPILRKGKFDTSFTSIIETRTGYSMVDDAEYEDVLFRSGCTGETRPTWAKFVAVKTLTVC